MKAKAEDQDDPGGAPYPWRQILLITVVSLALFVLVRRLPTGTNLSHMDFRVQGGNIIQFCDPTNPQFIPVVAVRCWMPLPAKM